MKRNSSFFRVALALILVALVTLGVVVRARSAPAASATVAPDLTVMTRNVYFGANPTALLLNPICATFEERATEAYQAALASDFPLRAAAIADEIVQAQPDFVGMQEAVIWDEQWTGGVTTDFLALILAALSARGGDYTALATAPGTDVTFPTTAGDVRLRANDVLLARSDAAAGAVNIETGRYSAMLTFLTCIGRVSIPRQWAAADVDVGGTTVRIITTHLEAVPAPLDGIRKAQARELLAGPAAKPVPTVLLGDFNAEPDTAGDAAALILAAGYADSWPAMQPGLTCCQAADLRNSTSELATRIDLVFNKGDLVVASAARTGATPLPPGTEVRWASDHAGVVVRFRLFPPQAWLPLVTRGD